MLVKFSVPMRFVVLQKAMIQWNDNVIYIYIYLFYTGNATFKQQDP